MIQAAYRAAPGYEAQLEEELRLAGRESLRWQGALLLSEASPVTAAWALDTWTAPALLPAPSVKAGADALRAIQRNWDLLAVAHHRRAALIAERLPPLRPRLIRFPEPRPTGHLGGWTLLDGETILASPTKTSPFLGGAPAFEEDRTGPPSRAYLKLWEACTRIGAWPRPGERCADLGAAPGGWTWAIASLGAQVVAIDKAALAPDVAAMPAVTTMTESAFALDPDALGALDWLFSDVIAYPERLLGLVLRWISAGTVRRIVCTIKFQGATDHATAARFASIEGGELFHSAANKHELTFAWARKDVLF